VTFDKFAELYRLRKLNLYMNWDSNEK